MSKSLTYAGAKKIGCANRSLVNMPLLSKLTAKLLKNEPKFQGLSSEVQMQVLASALGAVLDNRNDNTFRKIQYLRVNRMILNLLAFISAPGVISFGTPAFSYWGITSGFLEKLNRLAESNELYYRLFTNDFLGPILSLFFPDKFFREVPTKEVALMSAFIVLFVTGVAASGYVALHRWKAKIADELRHIVKKALDNAC